MRRFQFFKQTNGTGWCGSVDAALACKPKVADWIPRQSTCLGFGPGPQLGHAKGNHTWMFLSFPLSVCLSVCLSPSLPPPR